MADNVAQAYLDLYESMIDVLITEELHPEIKAKLNQENTYPQLDSMS